MLSLRTPSATPSAMYVPRSFGPRWRMMSVIRSRTAAEITGRGLPPIWITPVMPHMQVTIVEPKTVDRPGLHSIV